MIQDPSTRADMGVPRASETESGEGPANSTGCWTTWCYG